MTNQQLDVTHPIPDTTVFTLEESHRGYKLNKMCNSLNVPANRETFKANEDAYMATYGLSPRTVELVKNRDWAGLVAAGGNIYFLLKIGFVVNHGLYHIGAQMRGETFEQFLATRHGKGAR